MPYIGNDPVPLIYGLLNAVSETIDATSTTVVDGDRLVLRDASAAATTKMRQIIVEDLSAYLDDKITAMPNLVSVGALNVGSITSGFTSIDVGAGAITTTGIITGGTLEATTDTASGDNAAIGYTSAEGLILTGQGSTNDVTIKNDADADVLKIPTGTTNVDVVGNLGVGGNLTVTGTTAFNGGTITLGDAAADNVVFGADVNSSIIPNGAGGSFDLGSSGQEWRDLFINGTAHIDTLDVDENATVTGTLGVTGIATFTDDIIIGDGKTIGSASDVDAITIAANGQLTLTQTLIGTALDISGDIDVDGTTNLDIVDIDGAVNIAADVTIASTNKIIFNDASQFIQGASNAILDINATDEIELNATLVDMNANLDVSGTITSGGIITGTAFTAGSAVLAEAELELLDGLTAGTAIASKVVTTDANIDTSGQRNLTISGELDAATLDISGAIDVAGNSVLASVDVTGVATAATFEPDGDTAAGDNAAIGYTSAEGLILTGQGSTNDITIKNDADADVITIATGTTVVGIPGSLDIEGAIDVNGTANLDVVDIDGAVDMASTLAVTGIVTLTDDLIIGDGKTIGSASDIDAITIAANGQVTLTQTLIGTALDISGDVDIDGTTNLDVVDIDGAVNMATTLLVTGNVDFNGDLDVDGTTNLDAVDIDGAVNMATTLLVTGNVDFNGDLDVDGTSNLDVVDIDGAVNMATTALVTGVLTTTAATVHTSGITMPDDAKAIFGDGSDIEIYHNGTNSIIGTTNTHSFKLMNGSSNYLVATPANAVTLYHNNAAKLATASGGISVTGEVAATTLDISGAIDVAGTTNLDVVDIDGATNIAAAVTMATNNKIQFRDTAIHISSSADGQLDLVADTEIQIAATTIDINGAINASGEIIAASLDISGDVDVDGTLEADAITLGGTALATSATTDTTNASNIGSGTLAAARVAAAQTAITSILATDVKIGEDDQTKIDFETADEIHFYAANAHQIKLVDGALVPVTDNDIDLGTTSLEFKNAFFDGTVTSDAFAGPLTGNVTGTASLATVANSTANTNFPVVFNDESDALLDDTGALRYNPSTGTLLVPNLVVAGTTSTVDTVTMEAENAIVFEGATADDHETTLTIIDPTADRTINLPNQSGTIPVLAAASNTAVTSTPEELNILDGVTATAAEINLIDGGTSRGTTAVADGDGILINDAGTMRMTTVQTVSAYMAAEGVGGGNIVTTGALNSGTITSGFGNIDNGSSTITTTGAVATGALTAGGILKTDDTTAATTVDDGSLQTDGGLSVKLDAVIGDDLIMISDASVIHFGADADVNLTHVHNAGLTLNVPATADNSFPTFTLAAGDNNIAANDVLGAISFIAPAEGAGTDAVAVAASIQAISEGDFSASNNATKMSFMLGASEAATEKASLSSAGVFATASLDISGNVDVDGTLEADAITVNGTALAEFIADTAGAMFSSNTETGIAATYQDGDNTIDLVIGAGAIVHSMLGADLIDGDNIGDDVINSEHYVAASIDNEHLADNAVNTAEIANDAVTYAKMQNLGTADRVLGSTSTGVIGEVQIVADMIASGAVVAAKIGADAVTAAKIGDNVINSEHYAAASIDNEHLADNAVNTAEIANDAVTYAKMQDLGTADRVLGSTSTGVIGEVQIVADMIASGAVVAAKIGADAITAAKIGDDVINSEHYAHGSIDTVHIAADQITAALIADNVLNSEHYAAGSIDAEHLASNSVTTAKINADAVTAAKIGNDVINSEHYAAGSIDREHLAADIIDGSKIADDVINSEHYAAGSIDNEHIADDAINSEHYAAGSIDTAHIADAQVTGAKIAADTVAEANMANDAISSVELKSLATLLILDEDGSTVRTFHCAGA